MIERKSGTVSKYKAGVQVIQNNLKITIATTMLVDVRGRHFIFRTQQIIMERIDWSSGMMK